ncbi:transcriptional regulator, PadR-like family (plasmid) [Haloterrigena turkmenica DSM 5511]|uniref:Transcriptional regulator, PadR-like family n=1 Tax=Haloterrigena turkmenica (strain ATCC 51198 / DSM 5511 / JCM 9101 / NCIMB 13204 / VKM B-1734 / 4k) TaxID=543526 RepID=D2S3L9_HALTV|nr:helix-turn-helix transcriptional regulator [Haloterrigena turkmenica]ADB63966.1 transcriptional regulator, PadR-like family [Haloterrigena turkmenica DSM 5511]
MAQADTTTDDPTSELSGFKRDLLFVIADVGPAKGLKIKDEMEAYYASEVNHGRLYPNLDALVESGLVSKGQRDRRTNEYELTVRARQVLETRREWEAERFDGGDA